VHNTPSEHLVRVQICREYAVIDDNGFPDDLVKMCAQDVRVTNFYVSNGNVVHLWFPKWSSGIAPRFLVQYAGML